MASKAHHFLVHPAQGGLDTMTAPTLLRPDELQIAENIEYYNAGAKRKRLGTAVQSTSSLGAVQAMQDYWVPQSASTSLHQFLVVTPSGVYADTTVSGSWTNLSAFSGSGVDANIVVAQGYAVFSSSLGTQTPLKYDGSTISTLCADPGCVPNFEGAVYHLRRLFAFGEVSTLSTVYFSAASDITDWVGEDASSLIFDEDDGDRVVGLSKPFRGGLYVFKGPNVGSIHAVTGRTLRQLTRDRIMDTAPCVAHKTIITTPNDIYWMSSYGIHSLLATQKYGNTEEAYISHKIKNVWDTLQTSALSGACGFYHPQRNLVGWFVPEAGSTTNTMALVYNYVQGHWAKWHFSFNVGACMVARDPSSGSAGGRQRLYLGGSDGYVRAGDQTSLYDDGSTGYTAQVRFATVIRLGDQMNELTEKSFQSVTTFFSPNADTSAAQLSISVDGRGQTFNVGLQSSTAPIFDASTSIFDQITFDGATGGVYTTETPFNERGRNIEIDYVQPTGGQDFNILGYGIRAVPAEPIAMESS